MSKDIKMNTKKGRALLWTIILDSDLNVIKPLTHYEDMSDLYNLTNTLMSMYNNIKR